MIGRKISRRTCTKYLGALLDNHLLFKDHIITYNKNYLENHLLSDILKTVQYSLFDIHQRYTGQVWG